MKTFIKTTLVLLVFTAVFAPRLEAQNAGRTLIAASLYVAVDDWGDFYLNGIPIIDSQTYTSPEKGFWTIQCIPEHLCYFKRENIFSILVEKSTDQMKEDREKNKRSQDSVGIAYVLRMRFSDATEQYISSNDAEAHKSLYLADKMMTRPGNWMAKGFNDSRWANAFNTGFNIPFVASLNDPQTGIPIQFLSANSTSPKAHYGGERHLFRRKFNLDMDVNPNCLKPIVKSPRKPEGPRHVVVPPAPPTPTPWPVYTGVYPALPTPRKPYFSPKPTTTPTPSPTPTVTFTPVIVLEEKVAPIFNSTPTMIPWAWPTQEPIVMNVNISTPTPTHTAILIPTYTYVPAVSDSQAMTFSQSSGNIYINFADGSGNYRLEVLDSDGRHVKTLFDKRVIAQKGEWAEWDGKDESGNDAPPGRYTVVLSKGDAVLNTIFMVKTKEGL